MHLQGSGGTRWSDGRGIQGFANGLRCEIVKLNRQRPENNENQADLTATGTQLYTNCVRHRCERPEEKSDISKMQTVLFCLVMSVSVHI